MREEMRAEAPTTAGLSQELIEASARSGVPNVQIFEQSRSILKIETKSSRKLKKSEL
jgi:hypothetical protein